MSSVNIRHYGPALFMKLPLSSLALLSISHMKRPPVLNNIHRKVRSHSHIHKNFRPPVIITMQACLMNNIANTLEKKKEQTCGRLAYSCRPAFPLFPLTFINRDHTERQEHSVSLILFYPLFFLGCRGREHLK